MSFDRTGILTIVENRACWMPFHESKLRPRAWSPSPRRSPVTQLLHQAYCHAIAVRQERLLRSRGVFAIQFP
eukprot:scaffold281_cov318-Pavlova_lutheri.AAC.17